MEGWKKVCLSTDIIPILDSNAKRIKPWDLQQNSLVEIVWLYHYFVFTYDPLCQIQFTATTCGHYSLGKILRIIFLSGSWDTNFCEVSTVDKLVLHKIIGLGVLLISLQRKWDLCSFYITDWSGLNSQALQKRSLIVLLEEVTADKWNKYLWSVVKCSPLAANMGWGGSSPLSTTLLLLKGTAQLSLNVLVFLEWWSHTYT